jgi:peptide/nickel transport system substrate-binding protein
MIAAQLRKVGIEAVPRIVEYGAFVEKHERHEFDAFVSSWRESTKVDLKSVFHSASIKGGYDYGSYADAELDALIDRARAESDAVAARDLWRRAAQIVVRDQPFTFLFERDRLHAVPRRLRGMRLSPRSAYAGLEEWSLAADPASERTP